MKARLAIAFVVLVAVPFAASAQTPPTPPPGRHTAPAGTHTAPPGGHAPGGLHIAPADHHQVVPTFEHMLFPPELVMQHQRALELTAAQRAAITDAVKVLQSQTVDLQWNLQAEQTALGEILAKRPINEQAAVAQMEKLLGLESNVKRTHLSALIRIKNTLNDKQIQQLQQLRDTYPMTYDRLEDTTDRYWIAR